MEDTSVTVRVDSAIIESVVADGDLGKLTPEQRVNYYHSVCESMGLNPLTQPFAYIRLNNKLTLYAKRDAADQLRKIHGISIDRPTIEFTDDLVMVTVMGRDKTGRTDSDLGTVSIGNLHGEAKANAILKAITKAKRRLTLSIVGLGWLDETEVETIPEAQILEPDAVDDSPPAKPGDGSKKPHWIDNLDARGRAIRPAFWKWTKEQLALTEEQVYEALGVEHVHDFTGSMEDAKAKILGWVDAQATMAQAVAATPQEFIGE